MSPIDIQNFTYDLPDSRIALHPLKERDGSKLLVYHDGAITHSRFEVIDEFLPDDSLLFFNDTKVIPARILFTKATGGTIEIFLLRPQIPHLIPDAMQATGSVQWECVIGNAKRWKDDAILTKKIGDKTLEASLINREQGLVRFSWLPGTAPFAEIMAIAGQTPLPPYIKRTVSLDDRMRYQTIYSSAEGAVAAPTAGLHFTETVLTKIERKGIASDFLTLHVGAGTFAPVKTKNAVDHIMHTEQVVITMKNIETLLLPDRKIVAVGTTSLRTLESLYWYGAKLLVDPDAEFVVDKMDPYSAATAPLPEDSFRAVLGRMKKKGLTSLVGETSIFILPGYTFRVCHGLITNFHQPGSTLILLVAAFVGEDWKRIYAEALEKDYRFLSYGDSSLLWRS